MRSSTSTAVLIILSVALCRCTQAQRAEELPELASILTMFSAHATDSNGVRLNWSLEKQSPTIIKYRLYRGYEEVGGFTVAAEVEARAAADSVEYSFADETARPHVTYYYKIAAAGQTSESVFPVVISATPGVRSSGDSELEPATVLADSKITLYVRRSGKVKLEIVGPSAKKFVDEEMKAGIYQFEPPPETAGGVTLHLVHNESYRKDISWPVR